ncbi:MAG: alpha-L-fucosidase [Bacteroidales bacterium]|nr:alpha-L-fucosidase [Bacteroidales bacterium]
MKRIDFIQLSSLAAAALVFPFNSCTNRKFVPKYLKDYRKLYSDSPQKAAIEWFTDARFGLFIHYGLYSLLGRGEWVQYWERIPVKEYEKLKSEFLAENFNPKQIVNLASEAEMKYINITTRHHDSFCLFNTKTTDFNSVNSAAKRDLVYELANECERKGIGLCLYYSHGRDWRHPHAPNNDKWGGKARPLYEPEETYYKYGQEHDLNRYVDFMHEQLTELLTNYGAIASIWLDGWGVPVSGDISAFRVEETYKLIRNLQPQTLISAKFGYNGDEDYYAPEIHWLEKYPDKSKQILESGKAVELCSHISGWGYQKNNDGKHRGYESVMEDVNYAAKHNANLLLNTAPLPDGSIDKQDVATLQKVGAYLRENGWPGKN